MLDEKKLDLSIEDSKKENTMDELLMNLQDYEELDPVESPACIIGRYFFVSS